MRVYQLISTDGGRIWPERRRIDLSPHQGASSTGPVIELAGGVLAQPFEHWKARLDPEAGRPAAWLRLSTDGGATWPERRAGGPPSRRRHLLLGPAAREASRRRPSRQHVLDPRRRRRPWTSTSTSRGRRRTVATGPCRSDRAAGSALPAHLARGRSPAGRLFAPWRPAGDPRRAERGLRAHLGSEPARSSCGRATRAANRAPGGRARRTSTGTTWAPGSSAIHVAPLLPDGEVLVVFYGGSGATRSARWARLRV